MASARPASDTSSRIGWSGVLVALLSSLLTAVVGGLIGGFFAADSVEQEASAGRESAALQLRREALDDYVQAYAAAVQLESEVFREASDIADGSMPADESIMAAEGGWKPGSFRLASSAFPAIRDLQRAAARLEVLFSSDVTLCTRRIDSSFRIHFWELSALATEGNFEWLSGHEVETTWREQNAFSGLFSVMRGSMRSKLVALGREETELQPLDGEDASGADCDAIPFYVRDSSTTCPDGSSDCLTLDMDDWDRVVRGAYEPSDFW